MDNHNTTALHLSKHRIEALVDGIFAVAMTLLVIDLRLPEHLHMGTDAELREALVHLLPNFYSWLVSFIVLAIFWVGNHRVYSHVRHVDGALVWFTIMLLGGASLLPFASAVNAQFLSQLGQTVYASVMTLMGIGSLLVANHIYRHPELCVHPIDKDEYRGSCIRTIGLIVIAALTVPLATHLPGSSNMAFLLLFAFRPLNNLLSRRLRRAPAN
ncbi:TMEM175 family protein [Pseudoduganella sp. RAF53_2]|uniref:TMEM175 family protein n=1 Tax=unclassified Pseudoduganella TaxID=2637179 RepID=UPI003F94A846